jgi:hypothetical protein
MTHSRLSGQFPETARVGCDRCLHLAREVLSHLTNMVRSNGSCQVAPWAALR